MSLKQKAIVVVTVKRNHLVVGHVIEKRKIKHNKFLLFKQKEFKKSAIFVSINVLEQYIQFLFLYRLLGLA